MPRNYTAEITCFRTQSNERVLQTHQPAKLAAWAKARCRQGLARGD